MRLKTFLIGLLVAAASQAPAVEFVATNVYAVAQDAVVADEQWVVAGLAETAGVFENDLNILTGNPLNLSGVFEGNLMGVASLEAIMDGEAKRNLRLVATTVKINGVVGGNVMALADTILLGTNSVIGGDAILIANSVVQEGVIQGDASITATRAATLAGRIEGDARVSSQEILFDRDARVLGGLRYKAPKEIFPDEGIVGGELRRVFPPSIFAPNRLKMIGVWFIAAFLAGVPFISLFPMTTAMAAQLVRRSPWKCLAVGFVAAMALPMFGLMCVTSLVGLPLGALLLASWGVLFYLSRIILGLVIGTLILRSIGTSVGRVLLSMALGLALIYLATVIPSIGVPVQMTVLWLGMGSLILALLEKRRLILQVPANLKKLEELRDERFNPEENIK